MKLETDGDIRILTPEVGYKLYRDGNYYSKLYLGKNDSQDNYIEYKIITQEDKEKKILQSKQNLTKYLEEHPLLSTVKYPEGRYYNVTMEKQNLLLANISTYQMAIQSGMECSLTWNDTKRECELWTISQLVQLSMEIKNYVAPIVSLQQYMEVKIYECNTEDELLNINIEFTEEVIKEFYPIYMNKIKNNNKEEIDNE